MLPPPMTSESKPITRDDSETLRAYRSWGYLQADLDWLGRLEPEPHPELIGEGDAAIAARAHYCGTLAVELAHIPDPERRRWIHQAMETEAEPVDSQRILDLLLRAATLEEVLQTRYIGNKRFSIEGIEAIIPLLDKMLDTAGSRGAGRVLLAMSHRGRLNVMAHVVGTPTINLFAGFEDVDPESILGAGDVKYHHGATGTFHLQDGREVTIHLVSNPSHLEAVDPVALGRTRAHQQRLNDVHGTRVVPIVLHGDAAFAGQGIASETLNLSEINGFSVGGTVHVVVNNLIGFTAEPRALHSSRFSSDVAKRQPIPIFHVNGEDPEAVVRAAQIAIAYRYEFSSDVVVDLIGYRRHGHSEIDDPTVTQPELYRKIRERPPLWRSYGARLGLDTATMKKKARTVRDEFSEAKDAAARLEKSPLLRELPDYWAGYLGGRNRSEYEVATGLEMNRLRTLGEKLVMTPSNHTVHPKIQKLLDQRAQMVAGDKQLDFGMAEALALASLLEDGHPVRMSGQDTRRGTFNHRHAVLIDVNNGNEHVPLATINPSGVRFEIYDSILSEAAVLGYEYGFSRDYPEALVAWEAQFGDFANGAQTIFDQFVTAGEDKWGLLSGLIVLLPHGFEGQGPEHSSARIERFLQLAAEDAIQVVQPSTAGQYFHLLRRQVLRRWRKPLIVFTPKSMLRHAAATSALDELTQERFHNVLPESATVNASKILLCSGKIAHELRTERERRGDTGTTIVSIEQLYPFPDDELSAELDRFPAARELVWVQEEPANMGALFFVVPRIERLSRGRHIRTVKRSASASPATGSAKAHRMEQTALLNLAFA